MHLIIIVIYQENKVITKPSKLIALYTHIKNSKIAMMMVF